MKSYLLTTAMLLTACNYVNKEVSQKDRTIISAVEQAWLQMNPVNPKSCLHNIGVQTLSETSFSRICNKSHKLAIGCVRNKETLSVSNVTKTLYISPAVPPTRRDQVLVQLTLHALCECTASTNVDKVDSLQLRSGVWRQNDGNESVEALALDLLGL